jgi:hypothetical protein
MAAPTRPDDTNWHLDKKVQLPVIFLLAAQIFTGIWFASAMNSRVAGLEEKFHDITARLEKVSIDRDSNRDRLTILETQTRTILETVNRIDRRLEPQRP